MAHQGLSTFAGTTWYTTLRYPQLSFATAVAATLANTPTASLLSHVFV